ncbi:MAG: hypothetical protein NVSMB63_17610 [Sediminibacterium sp.]
MIDIYLNKQHYMKKYQDIATLLLRLATGANFLSAVASRFGFWSKAAGGGDWKSFLAYTTEVTSFAPAATIPVLAIAATSLEILFAFLLIIGYKTRWAALGAAVLTLVFALTMTYSFGIKSPLDYSVFVDWTSAFLLFTMPSYRWSVDAHLSEK